MSMTDRVAPPSRDDRVVAAASEVAGGPVGRFARVGRNGWQPAAVVLIALSSVLVALGVLQKGHCLSNGWSSPGQLWRACYSDLPVLHSSSGLATGQMPYLEGEPLDQPLLSGTVMWLVGELVPEGASVLSAQQWTFGLWAALIMLALAGAVLATVLTVPSMPWRAAHIALSPVLVSAALVSADLLGVLLLSVALLCWRRDRFLLTGVLLGLALLTRSYPLVVVVAIALVGARQGRHRQWLAMLATTVVTVAVVALPFVAVHPDGVLSVLRSWWAAGVGYGSLWQLPQAFGLQLSVPVLTWLSLLGWVLAGLAGAWMAFGLDRRPDVEHVALAMLVIVLLLGKAVPVQAALWVLPLVALAGLRWRDHLLWAGAEIAHFVAVWLFAALSADPDRGLPARAYAWFVLVRLVALGWLAWQVWRSAPPTPPTRQRPGRRPVHAEAAFPS